MLEAVGRMKLRIRGASPLELDFLVSVVIIGVPELLLLLLMLLCEVMESPWLFFMFF